MTSARWWWPTRWGPCRSRIYTTAAYQVPLVNIVQGALADVIFPDMVKRAKHDPAQGLLLWKRAQMLVFAVICPAWLLLTYWAEPFIRLLFTDAYVAATPYFQVFLLLMVRHCFQFSTPLRSVEDNASFAHRQSHRARHQRRAHRHADAEIRPVGSDARARDRADLDVYLPGIARAQALRSCRCPNCAIGAGSRSRWRHRWSRWPRCTPRSCTCRMACRHCWRRLPRLRWCMRSRRGIILREEYGYVMRAIAAPEDRMRRSGPPCSSFRTTSRRVRSVGAKRFSFLAREFTRLGFDVHVITNGWANRLPAGRSARCRVAGKSTVSTDRSKCRSRAAEWFTASPVQS